jgi:chemotaxis protein MotB
LSVARAVTIVRYLAEEEDVPPARLSAAGNAEFKPVALNDSRANRALNRRADIIIIYPNASRQFSLGVSSTENNSQ